VEAKCAGTIADRADYYTTDDECGERCANQLAATYVTASADLIRRVTQAANVTDGLICLPEMCPTATTATPIPMP
jgi:hypothetical protein